MSDATPSGDEPTEISRTKDQEKAVVSDYVEATPEVMERNHTDNRSARTAFGRRRPEDRPVRPLELKVGDVVRFLADHFVFTVQAITENYVVLTAGKKDPRYTIIEWSSGHRGPHSSWGHAAVTRAECEETALAIQAGHEAETAARGQLDIGTPENPWPLREVELSERNKIYLDLRTVERDGGPIWGHTQGLRAA